MQCYTKPHRFYCGIDLHARTMYVCILDRIQDRVEDILSILCTLRLQDNGSAACIEFTLLLRYGAVIACPMPVIRLDEEPSAPSRVLICGTDCTRIRTLKHLASRLPGEAIIFQVQIKWYSCAPNARPELLGAAGARHERTLFLVSSRPLFGPGYASSTV
jgi:hypothetical protein